MAMNKLAIAFCGLVAAAGLGLSGCDSGGNTDILNLGVKNVVAETVYAGANPDPAVGATNVTLSISGPGMTTVSESFPVTAKPASLPFFPEGYDRQVSVEYASVDLLSGASKVTARGRSPSLDVWQGDPTQAPIYVDVAPINSMVRPVHNNDQGNLVPSVLARTNRVGATVTELDDGQLLICGGADVKVGHATWYRADDIDNISKSCELYNPKTGAFAAVNNSLGQTVDMTLPRAFHQAIKLGGPNNPDGRVVLIGGYTQASGGTPAPTPIVEIYDPANRGTPFTQATEPLLGGAGRALFTADLVSPDLNYIVVMGGVSNFKSAGGTWDMFAVTETNNIRTLAHSSLYPGDITKPSASGTVRYNHSMVRVSGYMSNIEGVNKDVDAYLVIGGENETGIVDSVEVFLIGEKGVTVALERKDANKVAMQGGGRTMAPAVYVKDYGVVWIVGGFKGIGLASPTDRVDAFRVGKGNFNGESLKLSGVRGAVSVSHLSSKDVLISGGVGATSRVNTAELLTTGTVTVAGTAYDNQPIINSGVASLEKQRAGHVTVTDQTGRVMILGGVSETEASPDPIMYNPID